jgi:hypothetical protein
LEVRGFFAWREDLPRGLRFLPKVELLVEARVVVPPPSLDVWGESMCPAGRLKDGLDSSHEIISS